MLAVTNSFKERVMLEFATRECLFSAFWKESGFDFPDTRIPTCAKYIPHAYKGGWVIPGFGYSIERIGKYIQKERAGDPYLIEK